MLAPVALVLSSLAICCFGQQVQKTVTNSVPNCYPEVNGAKYNDTLKVHYTGKLKSNGKKFDSSVGGDPLTLVLGVDPVIKGWTQGLVGICPGEKVTLNIPSELGYGAKGN